MKPSKLRLSVITFRRCLSQRCFFTRRQFAKRGATVYATARSPEKMAGLREQGIHTLKLDVNDPEQIKVNARRRRVQLERT